MPNPRPRPVALLLVAAAAMAAAGGAGAAAGTAPRTDSAGGAATSGHARAPASFSLPPSCASADTQAVDEHVPIAELKRHVEAQNETDPTAAFAILCATIPRVARERGADSADMAWWTASLATPLIAYMDKFDEALPVLEFARPILEKHHGKYGEPLGDIHVAYAWIYMRQGRLAESVAAWREALEVRERHPGKDRIELQKVLVGRAQAELALREFAAAERDLGRAHDILVQNRDTVSEAGAAIENALTNVAFRQERYADARRHAEEQLRIEGQIKRGAQQLVTGYALLGRILERLDEYDDAERALRHAVELAEGMQGPLQRHHLAARFQLAALLEERNRAAEAREQAERALDIGEATLGPSAPRLVPVLQVLGSSEHQLGLIPEALHRFERAGVILAANRKDVDRSTLVDYYRDLGALQVTLGDTAAAESTLAQGLEAAGNDPTLAIERAWLEFEHSRAEAELGRPSRDELFDALALLRSKLPETHPAILRVLNELCDRELTAPDHAPSCAEINRYLERAPDTPPALRAAILVNLSRLALGRSDGDEARRLAVRAVAAAEDTGAPDPLRQAYFQLATVLRGRGETKLAIFFGKEALTQIENERSHFLGEDRRFDSGFLRDKVPAYRTVADWLLEQGRTDEGLAVLGLMKAEELRGFGLREAVLSSERPALLTDEESALEGSYARAAHADSSAEVTRLSGLEEAGKISPEERRRLQSLLAGKGAEEGERSERIEDLLKSAAAAPAPEAPATFAAPALARTAAAFGEDTAFAVYLLTEKHLRILMTARGVQQELSIPVEQAGLQRDIGELLDTIARRDDATALSRKVYDSIARPVDEFAQSHHAHRLVLWLDGSLRYVPVAALSDGQHYLLDKYAIQIYAPAPQTSAPRRLPAAASQVRGLGVTQAVAGFPALPAVADELCYVVRGPIVGLHAGQAPCAASSVGKGVLAGEGFADAAFTGQRFMDLLRGPRDFSVLHVGTHFRLRPGNALRSFLLLGDGSHLTLDTLASLDFSGLDVVTLSACETGLGGARTDDGREIEGLSALVERRGARRVVASLWPVEDVSTAELMRLFYASFDAAHGDAALGLQRAQRALRASNHGGASYASPFYWAGFVVSGSRP
ncbi:MAG TPA: CHAT domain-containing protein [Steroidobacteraceae bacterium]|nr:CHAT domain-containing protein [Steroidobacteraceae bacterium]